MVGSVNVASRRIGRPAAEVVRRLPFTSAVLAVMVALGTGTGTFWSALQEQPWFPAVGYGLPALVEGRWWTLVTGVFFGLTPTFSLTVLLSFAVFVGFAERRLGTRRAAVIAVGGQLVGVLGAAATLLAVAHTGWAWAAQVAPMLDVGFSAGALACGAATVAAVRPPWRLRLVAGLFAYVGVSFLFVGSLADLEHLWAVAVALPLCRRLAGPRAVPVPLPAGLRDRRLVASAGLALIAVAELVLLVFPADGPLGSTYDPDASTVGVLGTVAVVALVVNGLRRGRRAAWWWSVGLCALNVVASAGALLVAFLDGVPGTPVGLALVVAACALWAAELAVLVRWASAFGAPSRRILRRRGVPGDADRDAARALVLRHGGGTLSWMATWEANSWFRTADGAGMLAYQRHAGVAVTLGDPIAPPGRAGAVVREFAAMCETAGLAPCLFSVTDATVEVTDALGWHHVQVAEDVLLDLDGLEFRGKRWQDVRSALNRAAKEGITYREVVLADEPWAVQAQVRAISVTWAEGKALPEMGFTLGGVEQALDPAVRVGIAVDGEGSVHGVTSWLPVHGPDGAVHGWTLDLMRRRSGGFRPVVEFLIASAATAFRDRGARFVSLSGAPLARSGPATEVPAVERLLDTLGGVLEPVYGFRSLHAFKAKFAPRYEPLHLAYRDEGDLPRIGLAMTRAYLPGVPVRELVRFARGA